jgi:hypothetical protein
MIGFTPPCTVPSFATQQQIVGFRIPAVRFHSIFLALQRHEPMPDPEIETQQNSLVLYPHYTNNILYHHYITYHHSTTNFESFTAHSLWGFVNFLKAR